MKREQVKKKMKGVWGSKEHHVYHGHDSQGTYHVVYPNIKHRGAKEDCSKCA